MHAEIDGYILIYEEVQGEVSILRVYGDSPVATLPCVVNEKIITRIGAYCFSARAKLPQDIKNELNNIGLGDGEKSGTNMVLRPLCGEYLQEITLPDTINMIDDFAFYGCRSLSKLSIGAAVNAVGSDVFMNCKSLHNLIIRADIRERTVLQKILALINIEIEVSFIGTEGCVQAKVLYPMFTETYELLGPAHIFGLNLEGEGYRARKQFKDDVIDLAGYDQIFTKASHEERFETLVKMAIDRLLYPTDLSAEAQRAYEAYISENESGLMKQLVERGEEEEILDILGTGLISPLGKKAAIETAIDKGKTLLVSKMCRM